jgi:NAD+ kinase
MFEKVIKGKCDNVSIIQEKDLTPEQTKDKSLVISLGGDGCFLRTQSCVTSINTPMLGINTDPQRSLGILCGKFLYKQNITEKHIEKIFKQLEESKFSWLFR